MQPWMEVVLRRPLTRDCRRETVYLLVGLVTGILAFVFVVTALSLCFGLSFIVIGFLLAGLVARMMRRWCEMERRLAAVVLGHPVPSLYSARTGWLAPLRDRQTYLDGLWMFVSFPVGMVGFTIAIAAWSAVGALVVGPIWIWSIPGWIHHHDVFDSIIAPFLAVPAAVAAAWLVRGWSLIQAGFASFLLGPRRAALQRRVETLAATRAGAVDVSVAELQRVERDLHDGAQARLVALAMDLGLAEQRLAHADPETALEHVANARGQARAAMAELRDLVRGIAPSILNDRGLDAALTALVSGRNPPVSLRVDIPAGPVGPSETAAYFVVAEALTNARKHASASQVSVRVWSEGGDLLVAEVRDDGVGGAAPDAGSGLRGLRKRVAALDGSLAVVSPPGGPTTVRAELPWVS